VRRCSWDDGDTGAIRATRLTTEGALLPVRGRGFDVAPASPVMGRSVYIAASKLFVVMWLAAIVFMPKLGVAQINLENATQVPQSLRDVFDLPWCKAWNLECGIRCKKIEGKIVCEQTRQNCEESFKVSRCVEYNVPEDCAVWFDGCNTCDRGRGNGGLGISCTLMRCPSYVPFYACRRRFPDVK
jgi:hypothetical protein